MATLAGKTIASTYTSLLRVTSDSVSPLASGATTQRIVLSPDSGVTNQFPLYMSQNRVGINVNDPDSVLEVFGTLQQLKLSYDATDFCTFAVDTNHDITITPSSTGQIIFKPTTDSVDFFQVLDADGGTPILNVDSTNERVGIGTATPLQQSPAASVGMEIMNTAADGANQGGYLRLASNHSIMEEGERLGILEFAGAEDGSSNIVAGARVQCTATGNWGGLVNRGTLSFWTSKGNADMTQKMTILDTGNVGIGVIAPEHPLDVRTTDATSYTAAEAATGSRAGIQVNNLSTDPCFVGIKFRADTGDGFIGGVTDGNNNNIDLVFCTDTGGTTGGEHMRILQEGNVGIGTIAPAQLLEVSGTTNAYLQIEADSGGAGTNNAGIFLAEAGTAKWHIINNGSSTDRFDISDEGSDDGVYIAQGGAAWTDLSDERLKHSFSPIENAVDKLNTLQAVNFKWKYGSEKRKVRNNLGLIAQEVNEVFPEAVDSPDLKSFKLNDHPLFDGEKQAENAWGIAYSKIVPALVKAIQELSAKVDALENNNQQGDSSNEQDQEQSAGSGDSGGDDSSESSGEDSGGVEADSSDSSDSGSGASEASESSSDDGNEGSGGAGSDSSDDSEGGSGEDDSGGTPSGEPSAEWTKDQLKAYMDDNEIAHNSGDTKDDLLDKITLAGEGPDEG